MLRIQYLYQAGKKTVQYLVLFLIEICGGFFFFLLTFQIAIKGNDKSTTNEYIFLWENVDEIRYRLLVKSISLFSKTYNNSIDPKDSIIIKKVIIPFITLFLFSRQLMLYTKMKKRKYCICFIISMTSIWLFWNIEFRTMINK